jgi:hypothetical protein
MLALLGRAARPRALCARQLTKSRRHSREISDSTHSRRRLISYGCISSFSVPRASSADMAEFNFEEQVPEDIMAPIYKR